MVLLLVYSSSTKRTSSGRISPRPLLFASACLNLVNRPTSTPVLAFHLSSQSNLISSIGPFCQSDGSTASRRATYSRPSPLGVSSASHTITCRVLTLASHLGTTSSEVARIHSCLLGDALHLVIHGAAYMGLPWSYLPTIHTVLSTAILYSSLVTWRIPG